jgi:DNA mismatch repair protein MLH3
MGIGATSKAGDPVRKEALAHARVFGQVDRKFILAMVPAMVDGVDEDEDKGLLVLVDQHAADERIHFEGLCQELHTSAATSLGKPLVFEIDQDEAQRFEKQREYFESWYITYTIMGQLQVSGSSLKDGRKPHCSVRITMLPTLIAERCRAEPKLLLDLLRSEIWSPRPATNKICCRLPKGGLGRQNVSWLSDIAHCPAGMLEMLKSRACRTAIMFNDELNVDQCTGLVQRLAGCAFPFQCAHGRPSLTVLGACGPHDDGGVFGHGELNQTAGGVGFGAAWHAWTGLE